MRALDLSTARWRKSSYSSASNTCVEVAFAGQAFLECPDGHLG